MTDLQPRGGNRERAYNPYAPAIAESNAAYLAAELSSDDLLRRQLITGQHWITDPARFAEACASVGLPA